MSVETYSKDLEQISSVTSKQKSPFTLNALTELDNKGYDTTRLTGEEPGPVSEEYFDLIVMLNQTAGTAETVYGSYEDFKSKITSDNIVKVAATGVEAQTGTMGTAAFWFTDYVQGDPEFMQFAVVSNSQIVAVYWLSDGTWSLVDPTNGGDEDWVS